MKPLIDCRYCGSDDVNNEKLMGHYYQVTCNSCGATGPSFDVKKKHNGLWANEASCKAWNTGKVDL